MIETPMTGLVIDAMRNIVPADIGCFDSRSITPWAETCTSLPRRATRPIAPERSPAVMWRCSIWLTRSSRSDDTPTSSGLVAVDEAAAIDITSAVHSINVSAVFMNSLQRRRLSSSWRRIRRMKSAIAMLAVAALGVTAVAQRGGEAAGGSMAGVIDIHVHSAPDNVERSIDSVDVAQLAKSRGMRAIVLKSHYEPTATMAYIVRKVVPGIEVFGGIDLNLSVGGMNAVAVEHMTQVTGGWGLLVWMSTFAAGNPGAYSKENRPFVPVPKNGELRAEGKAVIGVTAKHQLVLATGHVSSEGGLMMLREGRRQGARHMGGRHAMQAPVLTDVAQVQQAAYA